MSYLLTEIALEMLGYKFYDIDGQYQPTNFHQTQENGTQDAQNEASLQPLQKLLGLNAAATSESSAEHTDKRQEDDVETLIEDDVGNAGGITKYAAVGAPSRTLEKLLTYECNKIREEVNRNLKGFIEEEMTEIMQRDGRISTEYLSRTYYSQEKKYLESELKNIQTFRKQIENTLVKVNPHTMEKYVKTFKFSPRSNPDLIRLKDK